MHRLLEKIQFVNGWKNKCHQKSPFFTNTLPRFVHNAVTGKTKKIAKNVGRICGWQ